MFNLIDSYQGKEVLIVGGLGFIGSNLALKLMENRAKVTILDRASNGHVEYLRTKGFNIQIADIRDKERMKECVRGKDVVFHLAAQSDHIYSNLNPFLDLDINNLGALCLLEACKEEALSCRVVFAGTRMQYGKVNESELPINEDHPQRPGSISAANKSAIENYLRIYQDQFGLQSLTLRLTNPYGPGARIDQPGRGIVNWFIWQAIQNREIQVFGDGAQLRDYIFISDVVEAFLIAGVHPSPRYLAYNVGSGKGFPFVEMTRKIVEYAGSGIVKTVPWPENTRKMETGDFYADISRIQRDFGWNPQTNLDEGLKKTIAFYKANLHKNI